MLELSFQDIIIRLVLSLFMGAVIGSEREHKNRPAGIRTHMLVCAGACVIALIQAQIALNALNYGNLYPSLSGVVRSDEARLIAQVVSGVGFLGAGTIIVTERSIKGLTTAASLWAMAGLGLAAGMGYYKICACAFLALIFALMIIKRILKVNKFSNLEIKYWHREATKTFIGDYFKTHNISLEDVTFEAEIVDDKKLYRSVFTIDFPANLSAAQVIEDLSMHRNVLAVRLISIKE